MCVCVVFLLIFICVHKCKSRKCRIFAKSWGKNSRVKMLDVIQQTVAWNLYELHYSFKSLPWNVFLCELGWSLGMRLVTMHLFVKFSKLLFEDLIDLVHTAQ